jgi:hypothetical protein
MLSGKIEPSLSGRLRGDEYSEDSEDGEGSEESEERRGVDDIRRITAAAEKLLRDGYTLVADCSEERRMTQQRAIALSDFTWGAEKKGRDRAFRSLKNESTLTTYFRKVKQLLAFYYRIVYRPGGHFSPAQSKEAGWVVPQNVIKPTKTQVQAMNLLATTLRR